MNVAFSAKRKGGITVLNKNESGLPDKKIKLTNEEIDSVQLFALLLAEQVFSLILKYRKSDSNMNSTLGRTCSDLINQKDETILKLKRAHMYFYSGSGNINDDYQRKRNAEFPGKDAIPTWIKEKGFSKETVADEILNACLEEVKTWWPDEAT